MHKNTGNKRMMPSDTGLWIIKPEGTRTVQARLPEHKPTFFKITTENEPKKGKYKKKPLYHHHCDGTRRKRRTKNNLCAITTVTEQDKQGRTPTYVQSLS